MNAASEATHTTSAKSGKHFPELVMNPKKRNCLQPIMSQRHRLKGKIDMVPSILNFACQPFARFAAIVMLGVFGITGCGTVGYMNQTYSGFKVIKKETEIQHRKVAVRVTSCVNPQGYVVCERRYGALTECSLQCKVPPNQWIERPEGYGGYEDVADTNYFLVLAAPDGRIERRRSSEWQYNEYRVGQIIGSDEQDVSKPSAASSVTSPREGTAATPVASAKINEPDAMPAPADIASMSIAEAQKRLTELGYQPGPADGKIGLRTVNALKNFQRDHQLPVSGKLDLDTIKQLQKRK